MATCYRTSGRTKSTNAKIVVPAWDSAWDLFNAENQKTTIAAMNAEGWKTIPQAADSTGLSRPRINAMALEGKKFEMIKRKVFHCGQTRTVNFIRPKTTTFQ